MEFAVGAGRIARTGTCRRAWRIIAALLAVLVVGGGAQARAADPVIAAAGDIACGASGGSGCRQMATSNLVAGGGLDAVLTLGDMVYECMRPADIAAGYEPSWGRVKAITKPIPGNHEYYGIDPANGCDGIGTGYFNYVAGIAGLPSGASDPTKGYYSYDIGDWHFIALNTGENCAVVSCANGSAQVNWLKADLRDNASACTVAYFHYPLFSSKTPLPAYTRDFWRALYDGGADIVLNGHVHSYERFAPQTPDGFADPVSGIRQFVVGTGGKSNESFNTPVANSEARISTDGVLKLTLGAGAYTWRFVNTAGTVLDTGTTNCHGNPGTADTASPTVSLTSPSNNATVFGAVTVKATASDDRAVASVRFFVDGNQIGAPDTTSFYAANLDTTTLPNGPHTLTALAMDTSGNQTTSSPRTIIVDNDLVAPSVSLLTPTANAVIAGQVALTATATDNPGGSGVARVEFMIDGTVIATSTAAPHAAAWQTVGMADGRHVVSVRATDARGNVSQLSHHAVYVRNVRVAGPGATSIARIALTGLGPQVLASPTAGSLDDPAYSPSHRRLVYTSPDGLVVAAADGTDPHVVPGTVGATHPGWGRAGSTLVFVRSGALYRIPTRGGRAVRLARGRIGNVAVSPDGRRILFQAIVGRRTELFVTTISGGRPRNITKSPLRSEVDPAWRDNATVAFAVDGRRWATFTMPRSGGRTTLLTAGRFNCRQPAFAPRTRSLACVRAINSRTTKILIFARTGRLVRALRIPSRTPSHPVWADQQRVTYVAP